MRHRPRRVLLAAVFGLQVAWCGLAFSAGSSAAAVPSASAGPAPLASAQSTATGSWAVVAMGDLGQPLNTFWQLFYRAPTANSWRLVTPPGVADNGGLTVAGASGPGLTVGFETSQLLRYSPLALTQNGGGSWTPALLPASLAAAPDALAVAPGTSGAALALVRRGTGQVLSSSGPLLAWHALSGAGSLTGSAAASCDVEGLDAVAFTPSSLPLVGAGCRRAGQVGVFAHQGPGWQLIGPTLHGSLAKSTTRVVRLDASASSTAALVAEEGRAGAGLLGLWRSATGTWTESLPLPLGQGQTILATAVGENGQYLVLVKKRGLEELAAGPGQPWVSLPSPPAGTVTVSLMADGSIDAFSVSHSVLRVFALPAHGSSWSLLQRTTVPLSYGSS